MLFDHIFVNHHQKRTLVLLHGTGGDKHDLLFLDKPLGGSYNLLGLQGNVIENGMHRFFRRSAVGVFDIANLRAEAENMNQFIQQWCQVNNSDLNNLVFLGYSNGANMILATLFYFPNLITSAVLLHPMLPFVPEELSLTGKKIMVTYGAIDPVVTAKQQNELTYVLSRTGAELTTKSYPGGHELSPQELTDIVSYLSKVE